MLNIRKIVRAVVAAVTSPEAVRAERSLAALVVTRILLAAGATDGLVRLVEQIIAHG